jgi:hypothetical protein
MLSAVDISRIVEVDRLTLRPNGINMTEEELVALAYEIRDNKSAFPWYGSVQPHLTKSNKLRFPQSLR